MTVGQFYLLAVSYLGNIIIYFLELAGNKFLFRIFKTVLKIFLIFEKYMHVTSAKLRSHCALAYPPIVF